MHLDVITGHDATAARLVVNDEVYVGTAKRHPKDRHDPVTAELLAISRALQTAADDLADQANRRIKDADRKATIIQMTAATMDIPSGFLATGPVEVTFTAASPWIDLPFNDHDAPWHDA